MSFKTQGIGSVNLGEKIGSAPNKPEEATRSVEVDSKGALSRIDAEKQENASRVASLFDITWTIVERRFANCIGSVLDRRSDGPELGQVAELLNKSEHVDIPVERLKYDELLNLEVEIECARKHLLKTSGTSGDIYDKLTLLLLKVHLEQACRMVDAVCRHDVVMKQYDEETVADAISNAFRYDERLYSSGNSSACVAHIIEKLAIIENKEDLGRFLRAIPNRCLQNMLKAIDISMGVADFSKEGVCAYGKLKEELSKHIDLRRAEFIQVVRDYAANASRIFLSEAAGDETHVRSFLKLSSKFQQCDRLKYLVAGDDALSKSFDILAEAMEKLKSDFDEKIIKPCVKFDIWWCNNQDEVLLKSVFDAHGIHFHTLDRIIHGMEIKRGVMAYFRLIAPSKRNP